MSEHDITFSEAVIGFIPDLLAFARSLSRNREHAEDLVQETVLKAWASRNKFQDGNLKAWLFTILRNVFCSERRVLKREVEDVDGIFAESLAVQPEHILSMEVRELNSALNQLSGGQRDALLLVCGAGMSCEEAAQECGCPIGTIKSRIARGRDRLADMLGFDGSVEAYRASC